MAIFNFPALPTVGQTYLAPNGVTYTWDGEKWVGAGAVYINPNDYVEKLPSAGNEQAIVPGQPGDTALRLKGATGQAANLLEFESANGLVYSVVDEIGRIGIGTTNPTQPLDVAGNIKLTGGISANNSFGSPGYHLVTNGVNKVYWAPASSTLDEVLAANNYTNRSMTVGDLNVLGDFTVRGTQTIIETEVIKLADNIITLNSNYTGNTPNEDAGIQVNRGTLPPKTFYWDESLDKWSVGTETFKAGTLEGNLVGNVFGTVSSLANHTTDNVREGTNNLYFTQTRARNAISTQGDIVYNPTTGILSYSESVHSVNGFTGHVILTADDIPEGAINKYGFSNTVANAWMATKSINDLFDVNTTTVANGDILYYDATALAWTTRAGDFQDNFVVSGSFNAANGNVALVRNDGNTINFNIDGRYLPLTGGTLTGPVVGPSALFDFVNVQNGFTANVAFIETLDANNVLIKLDKLADVSASAPANGDILYYDAASTLWKTIPGDFVDNFVTGASFSTSNGDLTITRNDGNTVVANFDGRYLELTDGGIVTGNTVFNGVVQANNTPVSNTDVTNKLYVDTRIANTEIYTANAVFDSVTGDLIQNRNDNTSYTVNLFGGLDARYVNASGDTVNGDIIVNGNTTVNGTLIANNTTLTLDKLADVVAPTAINGQLLTFNGTNWVAANAVPGTLNALSDVDVTGLANGDILYWNANVGKWDLVPGDFVDNFVNSIAFNTSTGIFTVSRNDGNTYTVDLDGRYLELATGGTVAGPTAFSNTVTVTTAPTLGDHVVNKTYVDGLVANSEIYTNTAAFDTTTGVLTQTRTNGTTYVVDLDGRYLELTAGGTVVGPAVFSNTVTVSTTPTLNNHVTNKAYVDGLVANSEVTVNTFTWTSGTGNLVLSETDGTVFAVNLDGRYSRTVNGVSPDANGNISLALTETQTGTLAARPLTANSGVIYVVSGDTANNNGETFIYVVGSGWQQIVSFDETANDARYVNVSGDTMTGTLTLSGDPTAGLHATTKQYVDALVANSEVYTNTAAFDTTTGVLTQTRTNGSTYTVDLDGRYLELTAGGTVAGATTFSNTVTVATAPTSNNHVTNKAYVDSLIANSEVYTNTATFDTATGVITLTRTNGSTYTVDVDGRYLELTAGGTVVGATTFSNTVTVATAPTSNSHVTNKAYVDALIANSEIYTNTATLDSTTGILTQTRTNGTTYTVDLFAGLDTRYVNASGDTVNGDIVVNGNTTVNGTLIANNTTLTLDKLADVTSASATTGQVLSFNGTNWVAANAAPGALSALSDVDVTGLANGDILYWNATAGKWDLIAGDFVDNFVNAISFDTTTGVFTASRNDGNTYTVDLDGRYLELANGGTVVGPTVFSNTVTVSNAPTLGDHVVNKTYVDGLVANSEIYTANATFDSTTGVITFTKNDLSTYVVDIDGRFAKSVNGVSPDANGNIALALTETQTGTLAARPTTATNGVVYVVSGDTANNNGETFIYVVGSGWQQIVSFDETANDARYVNVSGDTMTGALTLSGDPTAALQATTKQYVDTLVANSEVYTSNATFDATTGVVTFTRNDSTTYTVDIDGRFAKTVNGINPDANGNIAISLTETQTGTFGNRPISANGGVIYVVSGDANTSLNGKTYIYETSTPSWQEVVGFDQAAADARYVNVTGDAMTGALTLPADPTNALEAATKQYVDALVANSEVYTNTASFDITTGVLTQTRTNGSTYTVDLDGRYLETPASANTGQALVFNGTTWAAANVVTKLADLTDVNDTAATDGQVLTWDGVNGEWKAVTSVTSVDTYTNTVSFDTTTGVATFTRSNGTTYTVDLDGRYLELTSGGTVVGATSFSNTVTVSTAPTSGDHVTNKTYVDALIANSEIYTANAVYANTTGVATFTRNDGTTYTLDFGGKLVKSVNSVLPDTNGNVSLNITETQTGTLAARPTTATNGVVYVVSGDTANNNGETFIYVVGSGWQQIVSFDEVSNDARYVNVSGDTMTGALTLSGDPTVALHAATKQYVDALVANSEVYTNTAVLDSTTGILTQTRTNGSTYTVDLFAGLDARYVNVTGDTMTGNLAVVGLSANGSVGTAGQVLTSDGANTYWSTLTLGNINTYDATAPASPKQGDIWFDTTTGAQNIYWGGVWNDMLDGGTF